MKKKETNKSKQTNKSSNAEQEIHAAWVKETKAKAAVMLAAACEAYERNQAARAERFGRWSSVVDAFEDMVLATFDVAKRAVHDSPREVAKVQRVRDAVIARLDGDHGPAADLTDIAFTVGLLAQLADRDFGGLGIATLPDALLATLTAFPFGRDTSLGFARL